MSWLESSNCYSSANAVTQLVTVWPAAIISLQFVSGSRSARIWYNCSRFCDRVTSDDVASGAGRLCIHIATHCPSCPQYGDVLYIVLVRCVIVYVWTFQTATKCDPAALPWLATVMSRPHTTQLLWVRFWGPKIVASSCTYLGLAQVIIVLIIDI